MGYARIYEDWSFHSDRICYISSSDGTIIDFYTWLGFVSGFALMTREFGASHSGDCTRSDRVSKELATESGIKLGMRKNEIKKIIGVPALETENKLAFRYKWLEEITDPRLPLGKKHYNYYRVLINTIFSEDRLGYFEVYKTGEFVSDID